jgi:hypothetical protein
MQAHDEAKQPQIEPPPHSGAGSGAEAWRAYAHEVTDLDGTVLAEMNRAEIIALLEERNIPT